MNVSESNQTVEKAIIVSDGCCVRLGDSSVLDDVTFSIEKGKKVAVVGPNGGGKSTLFNAITGLLPIDNGSLTIYGKKPEEVRGSISYVPQKDLLNKNFELTVKQVVEMGLIGKKTLSIFSQRKTNLKIQKSLESVGLLEKIDENINNLSGGQFQRVLIARGLAQNADILILDEATSSIDSYSEDLIKNATKKITKGKTSIIIAHRLSTIESADKIIYMENGKILEQGNHKELLNIENGNFKKLYQEQLLEEELI